MRRRRDWWLSGRVVSTGLRLADERWLVTVRFANGAVLHNWLASRESAERQLAQAEQLRTMLRGF